MGDSVPVDSVGAIHPVTPESVGADQKEPQAVSTGVVVHPLKSAPIETPEVQPGQAPETPAVEHPADDDWKSKLPPDVAKRVDQVITELRQKDTKKTSDLEARLGRVQYAEELSRLASSENPTDRLRAITLLESTADAIKKLTPQTEQTDPLSQVDWESAEAVAPGIAKAFQSLSQQNQNLAKQLGQVAGMSKSAAEGMAEAKFYKEAAQIESWAKEHGLPFDLDKVAETENKLGIRDLKAAYFATYGDGLVEAGKQAAFKSAETKRAAALPGGTQVGGVPTRPKFKTMQEHLNWVKTQKGITGEVEFK